MLCVFLAINKKYSIECYFPKGGKIGCKINDPGDNKFFTAFKEGAEFTAKAASFLFDEAGKVIQKIQADIKNLGKLFVKNDFKYRIECIRTKRAEINRLNSEINGKESEKRGLENEWNRLESIDIRRIPLSVRISLLEGEINVLKGFKISNELFFNGCRFNIDKIERDNEEEFLVNNDALIDFNDNKEKELYLFRVGKRKTKFV